MKNLPYWITTGLFSLAFTASGLMTLTRQPPMVAGYEHLGYPVYLMTLLGLAKLSGVATLLAPGLPRLKEWAYAGFAINLVGAAFSHLSAGDGIGTVVPIAVLFGLAMASWYLRPESRKLASAARTTAAFGARPELGVAR
jgi:hypothetical protein